MTMETAENASIPAPARTLAFERFAGGRAIAAGLNGFLVNPVLYIWLGVSLMRRPE